MHLHPIYVQLQSMELYFGYLLLPNLLQRISFEALLLSSIVPFFYSFLVYAYFNL